MAPAICGRLVQSRHDILRLGWSLMALVTIAAFISSLIFSSRNKAYYEGYIRMYETDDAYNNNDDGEEENNSHSQDSQDAYSYYTSLAALKSSGMRFASFYSGCWAAMLVLCGGHVVHGTAGPVHLGAYMGALVMYANWSLVTAVTFGEFWVYDNTEQRQKQEMEISSYSLERSSVALSTLSLLLSIVYLAFATILFFNKEYLAATYAEKDVVMLPGGDVRGRDYNPPTSGVAGVRNKTTTEGFITRTSSDL